MKQLFKKIIIYILKAESRLVLWKYKPKVVAITGSVGKTSTKDAVYATLALHSYVRKSDKSYNSELGLPLTILGCPNGWNNPYIWLENILKGFWLFIWPEKYPNWLVLEVGIGKPGDMKKTAMWLKTDAVIITAIGETPVHIEFFSSRKDLIEEKSGLIQTLKKDGLLVLNRDDEVVFDMKTKSKSRTITYGFDKDSDVVGSGENISYDNKEEPTGIIFRVDVEGNSLPVSIEGVFGRNHVYATLGALALSFGLKFNMIEAANALKNYDISPGRMRLLQGINDSLIIDDTYNSSPFACESALRTLHEVKSSGRKVAILGDMLELGRYTKEAHHNIGKISAEFVKILAVVGPRAEDIKEGAIEAGMKEKNIFQFSNSMEAGESMKSMVKKDDIILIKGSQGMRMERTVEVLMVSRENKENLLVRQDKEWQRR